MSTIQEVATKANVSTATVSRYLNGHKLKPENEARIQEAIDELGYKENYLAKSLRYNKTLNIGVLTSSLRDILTTQIICALEDVLNKHGYMLTVSSFHNNHDEYESKMQGLIDRKIDGLVLIDVEPNWEFPTTFNTMNIPAVAIASDIKHVNVNSIVNNCSNASYAVTQEVINRDHNHIAILTSNTQDYTTLTRLSGVASCIKDNNLPDTYTTIKACECSRQAGYEACLKLLDEGYDCILSCNYTIGQGALQAIFEADRTVGKDISFATYSYKTLLPVTKQKITAICPKAEEMGETAANELLDMIQNNTPATNKVTVIPDEIFYVGSIVDKTNQ